MNATSRQRKIKPVRIIGGGNVNTAITPKTDPEDHDVNKQDPGISSTAFSP
jgi:hypothetical protein